MSKQKQIENKNYQVSDDIRIIAEDLIKNEPALQNAELSAAKIEYLLVFPQISKFTAGRCYKANKHVKFFNDLDFIIEVSGELWHQLDEETMRLLVLHELMHIHVGYNEKKASYVFKINDHDVKDFHYIISKYGIDWFTKLKTEMASIYDLEPKDEKKITL